MFRSTEIQQSAGELVSLTALTLDTRYAILRFFDGTVLANDDAAPAAVEAELSERVSACEESVVSFTGEELSRVPDIGFYAAVPVRDEEGRALGTFAVFDQEPRELTWSHRQILMQFGRQIAHLFEIDVKLESVEARLRRLETISDALPLAAYVIENGRFAMVNATFARALGYTKDELIALNSATEIIVSDDQEFVREMLRRREAGEQNEVRYITQIRARDGRICDAEIHGSVAYVDGRRLLIGAAVDITVHSQERRRTLEREEHFRALTENVSDLIVILDRRGIISYITPSVGRMLGYSPDDLIGKDYCAFVHPDDRDRVNHAFGGIAATDGAPFSSPAYRFRAKNGSWKVLESLGTNLLHHPQVRGLVLNTRDITDRKVLEQQVEQLHRLTSLGRLSAQVAHEFNNVLMGIQPFAEVVRRHSADGPQLEAAAEAIVAAVARGKRITTDILRFGRPAHVTLQTVKVSSVIRQAIDEIRPVLPQNITLETVIANSAMYVHGDPAQLAQVLINLMLNARDAMQPSGGTLAISARPSDGYEFAHFAVRDTGEGITDEDLPYIFEPLFTTKKSGTGLGLSVVWQIVAAHHGRVFAESVRGAGTTFHVYIPSVAEPAVDDTPPAPARERQAGRKVHVLLVEDDPTVAGGLKLSLQEEGFEVSVAATGAEVLPRIAERKPDVVILDLSLPDEDGRHVYERIMAVAPLPVVFSSGHARETDIGRMLDTPRTSFLMKPYTTEELLRTIDELLDGEEPNHDLSN
jgi:two-component system cell cycle sensor histidine kinase/response regulator CckA